ncbi:histidinol-phosphate transaminase [Paenibacillus sp. GCM10012306]|uniref:histidinol-phosphate transaminase n=1 Tax=Paenibacillus sp. GCM10012306 TaxID=3317342 RepID=UPI003616274A
MYIKQTIEQLTPYVPGTQPQVDGPMIKINANENPYPPSPRVKEILSGFDYGQLRYYPDATSQRLRALIGAHFNLSSGHVFCGNGSDEIIAYLFQICLEEGDSIATPYPTYTLYKTIADIHRVHTEYVPTRDDFSIDIEALINTGAKGIFIANPNAQTGLLLSLAEIEHLLQNYEGLVVIDEAYIDFAPANASAYELVARYPNLVVLRTFSKSYSLCGIRVGFCLAAPTLVNALDKCRDSYNVSHLSQLMAAAAFEDQLYLQRTIKQVVSTRKRVSDTLISLGFEVLPSQANFLLCKPRHHAASDIYDFLKSKHIYVRYFDAPQLSDKLRISVGTDEEMDVLLEQLTEFISN